MLWNRNKATTKMAKSLWDILANTQNEWKPRAPSERKFMDIHTRKETSFTPATQDPKLFHADNIKTYDRTAHHQGRNPGDEEVVKFPWRLSSVVKEQTLDELSPAKIGDYVKKASADVRDKSRQVGRFEAGDAVRKGFGNKVKDTANAQKTLDKANNRVDGIKRAFRSLALKAVK